MTNLNKPGDVVVGLDVLNLPMGSWVLQLNNNGEPMTGFSVGVHPDLMVSSLSDYMIIKVAPLKLPEVGSGVTPDQVESVMAQLPQGSIIVDIAGDVGRKDDFGVWKFIDDGRNGHAVGSIAILRIGS